MNSSYRTPNTGMLLMAVNCSLQDDGHMQCEAVKVVAGKPEQSFGSAVVRTSGNPANTEGELNVG